jgi:hypothetical protein
MDPTATLTLRDARNVHAHVVLAIERLGLAPDGEDSERLIAAGVEAVRRIERALPPEQPLRPVLDEVLEQRVLALWEARPRPATPAPAIAAPALAA